jgi:hypothetical protein
LYHCPAGRWLGPFLASVANRPTGKEVARPANVIPAEWLVTAHRKAQSYVWAPSDHSPVPLCNDVISHFSDLISFQSSMVSFEHRRERHASGVQPFKAKVEAFREILLKWSSRVREHYYRISGETGGLRNLSSLPVRISSAILLKGEMP